MKPLEGMRILFADDSLYNMRPTREALETAGAAVDKAIDGTEVIQYFRDHEADPPGVLILDIMMAGGQEIETGEDDGRTTGVEVYKRLKRMNISVPIVVSTVVSDQEILKDFRTDNVPILEKPYRYEDLQRLILKVTKRAER
jgi:CheY-like chemotaxis protein